MNEISDFFKMLLHADQAISKGGLGLVTLIVYLETGWFFCFFLPGDYLLFLAGMFCASGMLKFPIEVVALCIFGAAVLGNLTGYLFGVKVGENFMNRKESWFFKKEYVENTKNFFLKYGGKSLVIGRFMPIIRTFAPLFAGIAKMRFGEFFLYNVIGAVLWTSILVFGGYFLGRGFPGIINYVHYVIFFFLGITTFTVIKSYLKIKKEGQLKKEAEDIS
jgi:membrane-associated protein